MTEGPAADAAKAFVHALNDFLAERGVFWATGAEEALGYTVLSNPDEDWCLAFEHYRGPNNPCYSIWAGNMETTTRPIDPPFDITDGVDERWKR